VLELTGEYVPSADQVLNSYYNVKRNRIDVFVDDFNEDSPESLVLTASVQRSVTTITSWLALGKPILVCGPPGSGKGQVNFHYTDADCSQSAIYPPAIYD